MVDIEQARKHVRLTLNLMSENLMKNISAIRKAFTNSEQSDITSERNTPSSHGNSFKHDSLVAEDLNEEYGQESESDDAEKIRAAALSAILIQFEASLSGAKLVKFQSRNGDTYSGIQVNVKTVSSKGVLKEYTKVKPMFSDEAQLLASMVPFDPKAHYIITAAKKGSKGKQYSEWVKIEKVV